RRFLRGVAGRPPRRFLDLDDVESTTHARLAALYRELGDAARAAVEEAEAARARPLEEQVLREFERVFVCSEADGARLRGRGGAEVCVLPNAVRLGPAASELAAAPLAERPSPGDRERPFTLLFVGTLGYAPNADGARFVCGEVLPRLRRRAGRAVRV